MSWVPKIGAEFAGYRLESLAGHGGMSVVYRAEHQGLGRMVALKLLSPQLTEDEGFRERFQRESRIAAALEHPNVIPIYEAGDAQGVLYIAMRYVQGSDLKSLIKEEGPLPPERVSGLISQIAGALDAAHGKGLVHRDVKPANVLVAAGHGQDGADHVYLSDFGVAKATASRALTKTGMFVGTAEYAAPEQIEGKPLDGRADVYSLGCVLYECLTGVPAYDRDSEVALMYAHLLEPPPSACAKRGDLSPDVDAVIAKAMAKSPDDRYQTAKDLAIAAREALAARPAAAPLAAGATVVASPSESPSAAGAETVLAGTPPPAPGETVVQAPESAAAAPGEPARVEPAPQAAAGGGWSGRRLAIVGVVAALVLAGVVAAVVVAAGGDDDSAGAQPGTTAAQTTPGGVTGELTLERIVPPPVWAGCSVVAQPPAGSTEGAVCPPAGGTGFSPDRWEISEYPSSASLQAAYEAARDQFGVTQRGAGRCDGASWGGEGPWLHGPDKPGGNRFCAFDGDDAVIVWTHEKLGQPDHANVLAIAREGGSDHASLFNWWRFWHHRIGKALS